MKNYLFYAFIMMILFCGCVNNKVKQENSVNPDIKRESLKDTFWLDKETDTVHKITAVDGKEKVVSIIKYRDGTLLEVMKILSSENRDGTIHWIYFVPSTKYIVDLTLVSASGDQIGVEWTNRNSRGESDSGHDYFVKCDETGMIRNSERPETVEADMPTDFSLFNKIK